MIDWVEYENFKCLADVHVDLGRLTVLVGPNGSGKTSVLEGIEMLAEAATPREGEEAYAMNRFDWLLAEWDPTRLSRIRPGYVKLRAQERAGDFLEVALGLPPKTGVAPGPPVRVSLEGPNGNLGVMLPTRPPRDSEQLKVLTDPRLLHFASVEYLHLDAAHMAAPSHSTEVRPRVRSDGAQLASALAWMKGAREEELEVLTRELGRIVPGVRKIRTMREAMTRRRMDQLNVDGQPVWRPVEVNEIADRFEVEFNDGHSVPSDLLSEGTVLALGLLTKLHEPERPRLLLLDDIDRGLHIEAQARLVEVLRELLALDPELQIVCTTHSPYLLDRFDASEVRMLALDAQRKTRVLQLDRHPDFEQWRYGTQTGELWAALGDAWVNGPKPAPQSVPSE